MTTFESPCVQPSADGDQSWKKPRFLNYLVKLLGYLGILGLYTKTGHESTTQKHMKNIPCTTHPTPDNYKHYF